MMTMDATQTASAPRPKAVRESKFSGRVLGLGDAGASALEEIIRGGFAVEHCAFCHSDDEALARVGASGIMPLGIRAPRAALATDAVLDEDQAARVREFCAGAEVVFIVAGLGGRTGTELTPPVARAAKASGAIVLAFVTLPFDCEGSLRQQRAQWGLEQLAGVVDGVLCLPNQKLFGLIGEETPLAQAFSLPTKCLAATLGGVWRMLARPGTFSIHLQDFCALLSRQPDAGVFAAVEAAGPTRSAEVVEKLFAHPLLDGGQALRDAEAVLVSIAGASSVTMAEVNRVMDQFARRCEKAHVMMGTAIDESLADLLTVTVFASSETEIIPRHARPVRIAESTSNSGDSPDVVDLGGQLLPAPAPVRSASRVMPPAPEMTTEEMQRLLAKQESASSRRRKVASKLRQGQLPLEIVSKGRFDQSEPTIHKGEDLDLPTYVRRGIVLN